MWVSFRARAPFAIKMFLGGINAVSGEPLTETSATLVRRLTLLSKDKSVQDYVVPPRQIWLDGIASSDGKVRQFVAMPFGTGYTVEAQVTGKDALGGLQFHVIPSNWTPPPPPPESPGSIEIENRDTAEYLVSRLFIKNLRGETTTLRVLNSLTTVYEIKRLIRDTDRVHVEQQRLIFAGKQLEGESPGAFPESWGFDNDHELADEHCLADYNIQSVSSSVVVRSLTWTILDYPFSRGQHYILSCAFAAAHAQKWKRKLSSLASPRVV